MNEKPVILHIITDGNLGGGNVNVARLIAGNSVEFDHRILLPFNASLEVNNLFDGHSFKHVRSPKSYSLFVLAWHIFLEMREVDLVHCHGTRAAAATWLAAKFKRAPPIIYTVRGYHLFSRSGPLRAVAQPIEQQLALNAAQIVYVSNSDRQIGYEKALTFLRPPLVIENGIEIVRVSGLSRDIDVTFVGRFVAQKDPLAALSAFARLRNGRNIVIVGDGALAAEVEELLRSLKHLNVETYGQVPPAQINLLLNRTKILVITSRWEGLPTIVVEAVLSGCSVIGYDIPSLRELSALSAQIHVLPERDEEALANAIEAQLDGYDDRYDVPVNDDFAQKFSHALMCRRYSAIYRNLIRETVSA